MDSVEYKYKRVKTFGSSFWVIFISFLIFVIIVCFLPSWLVRSSSQFDFTDKGQIGDTIGGIMGPFIAIAASILTFFAFWVQLKANEQQRYDIRIERFENKYYELIKLHRLNVEEIDIDGRVKGRKAFPQMISELRQIKNLILHETGVDYLLSDEGEDENNAKVLNLAYKIFFFGINYGSRIQIDHFLNGREKDIYNKVQPLLKDIQGSYKEYRADNTVNSNGMFEYSLDKDIQDNWSTLVVDYLPFEGRVSWLGHYYRLLFQTVSFIDDQPTSFISDNQKIEYLKMLRAQLSNEEQALLYYNAQSDFGNPWIEKHFFTKYFMLKNLPVGLIDMGLHPHILIGIANDKNEYYFEWDNIQKTEIRTIEQVKRDMAEDRRKLSENSSFTDGL